MPACRAGNHEKRLAFSHMDKACPMVSQVAPAHAAHVLQENVGKLKETAKELNPRAKVVVTDSLVTVDNADTIRGKKVVLVEDGPTLTHGGMPYGAGESLHHIVARHGKPCPTRYVSDTADTANFEPKWPISTDTATDTGRSTRFGHGSQPCPQNLVPCRATMLHHAWARPRVGLFRTLVADKYPLRSG